MTLPDPNTVRPEPCAEGFHYEWVPEAMFGWLAMRIVPPGEAKQCRFTGAGERCDQMSAAKINRSKTGTPERWWHYCADHLYGRRIYGQRVWVIHVRPNDEEIL